MYADGEKKNRSTNEIYVANNINLIAEKASRTSCGALCAAQRYSHSSVAFIWGQDVWVHSLSNTTAKSLSSRQNCLRKSQDRMKREQ